MKFKGILTALAIVTFIGCDKTKTDSSSTSVEEEAPTFDVTFKNANSTFKMGEMIELSLTMKEASAKPDSAVFYYDDSLLFVSKEPLKPIVLSPNKKECGSHFIHTDVFIGGKKTSQYNQVNFLSAEDPTPYVVRVLNTYPHDKTSYTQGLEFDGDDLIESSGQYEESAIRITNPKTAIPKIKVPLQPNIFAEGATRVGDEIFQLSWKEMTCFVYDRKTLQKKREFRYPISIEGWGLAFDGKYLIMTDGSNKLYYLDPKNPTAVVKTVQVCDAAGPVNSLNELEYINGALYANIYQTDNIIRINPNTGEVLGVLHCENLLTDDEAKEVDVLNGIAYNPKSKTLFITGKYWPKMFEVELAKGIR